MIAQNYLSILDSVQIQRFMRSLATQSKAEVEVDENKRTCVGGIKANILAKVLSGDASEIDTAGPQFALSIKSNGSSTDKLHRTQENVGTRLLPSKPKDVKAKEDFDEDELSECIFAPTSYAAFTKKIPDNSISTYSAVASYPLSDDEEGELIDMKSFINQSKIAKEFQRCKATAVHSPKYRKPNPEPPAEQGDLFSGCSDNEYNSFSDNAESQSIGEGSYLSQKARDNHPAADRSR